MNQDNRLLNQIPALSQAWHQGQLTDAEYACLYFLHWQISLQGRAFASRLHKTHSKPDPERWLSELTPAQGTSLTTLLVSRLECCHFKGIIPAVPRALVEWLRGNWCLSLLERIPDSHEVLRLQVAGSRPVTLMAQYPRMLSPVLKKANAFQFMVHDLEHAAKFFQDESLHRLQRNFFERLWQAEQAGLLNPYPDDAIFHEQIDYLISDMNTHPLHGLRFLVAAWVGCLLRREHKTASEMLSSAGGQELAFRLDALARCWQFSAAARSALLRLSERDFARADALCIEDELT